MRCHDAQARLNVLVDGEPLPGWRPYAALGRHCLACPACRSAWRRLRRERRHCRQLPAMVPPHDLRARVLGSLPAVTAPIPAAAGERPRRIPRRLAGAAMAAAVVLVGTAVFLANGSRQEAMAARVGAAVQRANTWHLQGWREDGGKRIPWEVWGRRRPFFYYEQTGEKLLVDNGRERLETFPGMAGSAMLAVRMPSRPTPEENRWARLTMGTNWRERRREPWKATRDRVIFRDGAAGMQGPGSASYDYYFVDRSTWLPQRWEYRLVRGAGEAVVQTLAAEYDVPLPPAVASLRLPANAHVLDATTLPSAVPEDANTRSGGGITARLVPVKVDPEGNLLLRLSAWLGGVRLGVGGDGLSFSVNPTIAARSVESQRHGWDLVDDLDRPYVQVSDLHAGDLPGERSLWLAPLEPPAGDALPRAVTVRLAVSATGTVVSPFSGGYQQSSFLERDFQWRLRLPEHPEPIREEDFRRPGGARVRDPEPVPVRIALWRAAAYEGRRDYANAIRWLRWGIDHAPPDSNYAQFMRGNLAGQYDRVGDQVRMAAVYREIMSVKERYPGTWGYYATRARQGLAELARRQPKPR